MYSRRSVEEPRMGPRGTPDKEGTNNLQENSYICITDNEKSKIYSNLNNQ